MLYKKFARLPPGVRACRGGNDGAVRWLRRAGRAASCWRVWPWGLRSSRGAALSAALPQLRRTGCTWSAGMHRTSRCAAASKSRQRGARSPAGRRSRCPLWIMEVLTTRHGERRMWWVRMAGPFSATRRCEEHARAAKPQARTHADRAKTLRACIVHEDVHACVGTHAASLEALHSVFLTHGAGDRWRDIDRCLFCVFGCTTPRSCCSGRWRATRTGQRCIAGGARGVVVLERRHCFVPVCASVFLGDSVHTQQGSKWRGERRSGCAVGKAVGRG